MPKPPETCLVTKCGILEFSKEETSKDTGVVTCQTLEYVNIKTNTRTLKKLKLVTKRTTPYLLVEHLKKNLFTKKFALHISLQANGSVSSGKL